jgi:uncharacterized protein YjbI with pentapeptide repeats
MKKEEDITNKCQTCGRPTHKESKYCIFHVGAEEKTEEEFTQALKRYVNKIKKEDGDYDFKEFIFVGKIFFKRDLHIKFFKNASFQCTTFEELACFEEVTFGGDTNFNVATFKGDARFGVAKFKGNADFWCTTFKASADFLRAKFQGYPSFRGANFEGPSDFLFAYFKGNAGFCGAKFKVDADFSEATFKGDADFDEATFDGDANFKAKFFAKNVSLTKIKLLSGKKLNLRARNNKVMISLERAYLENVYLDINLGKNVLIDFTGALLRNTTIKKGQIENRILQEKKKKFYEAQEIYLLLKNNFHSIGRYEDESWAFKKEKDMGRKSNCHFKTLHKWLWSCFLNGIFGYGIQPSKVIMSAILIITLFAFLFMSPGISNVVGIEEITSNNFFDCMYFSTITFTTLGYGDFRPLEGVGRILAGSEAFIGAFMMALFVYTFARRTGGR